MFASVVVDIKTDNLSETFDYIIPENLLEFVSVGSRVFVPFGSQKILGYILEMKQKSEFEKNAKEIIDVLDYDNDLSLEQIFLAKYISKTYHVRLVSVLELMIPSFLKGQQKKYIVVSDYNKLDPDLAIMFKGRSRLPLDNKIKERNDLIKKEIAKGNITVDYDLYTYGRGKKQRVYYVDIKNLTFKSEKKQNIYDFVLTHPDVSEDDIITYIDCSYNMIRGMVKDKIFKYHEVPIIDTNEQVLENTSKYVFNFDNEQSYRKYQSSKNRHFLLHSNNEDFKINFYIKVIEECKKKDLPVIITSPTIMLEEEVVMYLKRYLKGYKIYGMSSKNTMKERYDAYMNAKYDNLDVLVTTHNGIFLPFNKLGAIIVLDEENPNYINENYPYYNAIDVLKVRADYNSCDFILSTSSPSINTYTQALKGEYNIINANNIKEDNMIIVDMKEEILSGSSNLISNILHQEISKALDAHKQVMLLVQSKAYAQSLRCRKCGKILKCPKCGLPLTLFKEKGYAKCNYCDFKVYDYNKCSCGSTETLPLSFGQERISEEIKDIFKDANVLDINADIMKTQDDYNKALNDIEEGNVDIIIGTNILSKTIKSDNIKLVGIINADLYLNSNNHRANEYTFNLITKLSNKEKVIIQTYYPNNKVINLAKNKDYQTYYEEEMIQRNLLGYEPYMEVNKITIKGEYQSIYHFANYFKKVLNGVLSKRELKGEVLGPTYDSKARGVKLIIKHKDFDIVTKMLDDTVEHFKKERVSVDFERCPKTY